jgi:hypothetical protein
LEYIWCCSFAEICFSANLPCKASFIEGVFKLSEVRLAIRLISPLLGVGSFFIGAVFTGTF